MAFISNLQSYDLLTQFITENQDKFYRLAYSYVKNRETALDMVQEALISAYESVHVVKNNNYIKTWFYRILVNKCIASYKKRMRFVASDEIIEQTPYYDKYQAEIIDLYNAIDRLESKLKTVIVLRYFEDMKMSEIAEIVKSNESTVKSRISVALKKLGLQVKGEV